LAASSLIRLRKSKNLAAIPDSLSAWAQESARAQSPKDIAPDVE